jgi:Holliday junction resolvasome RuvABC endonuclease subunit
LIIAGLDIATITGAAVMQGDKLLHAEAFRPDGTESAEIFHGFRTHLRALLVSYRVEAVAAEEPLRTNGLMRKNPDGSESPMISMATIYRLYGMAAAAEEICFALNIPFYFVNMRTWRKAFIGNGGADKAAAVAQCKLLRFNVRGKTDAAEAVGVCWWLAGHLRVAQLHRPGELFAGTAA